MIANCGIISGASLWYDASLSNKEPSEDNIALSNIQQILDRQELQSLQPLEAYFVECSSPL
jgi:hypothetical protein